MRNFRAHVDRILTVATDTFGEDVEFRPKAGGSYTVRAIFDNEYQALDPSTEQLISVNKPILGININDLEFDLKTEDLVIVREITYKIEDKREDGQGGARLFLHKVNANERIADTRVR